MDATPQEQPIQPRNGTFVVSLTGALYIMGQGFDPIAVLLPRANENRQQPSFRFSDDATKAREDFELTKVRINRLISEAKEWNAGKQQRIETQPQVAKQQHLARQQQASTVEKNRRAETSGAAS